MNDLVNWLDNNRENIKRDNGYNENNLVSLYIYDEAGSNSNAYTYTFTKQGLYEYFNQRGNDYFNDLVGDFRNEKYLNVYFDDKNYYLNTNKVNKLYQMCKEQSLKIQDYFNKDVINLIDFEGNSYFIKDNDKVKEFIINECSSQTELINKCDEFLDDENNYLDTDNSLVKNYIEENYDIKNINDLYFTGYQKLGFDETQVSYSLELSATSEEDSYSGNIIIDLKEVDNEIVIVSIREVNKVLNLFKNDLKQLKNVIVIFISCLLLNYLIGIMSFDKDIIRVMFYLTIFIFSLIIPMINLQYLFNSTKQTHFNSLPITRIQGFIVHYLSGIICLIIPAIIYCWLMKLNCLDLLLLIFVYYSLVNLTAYCTTSFITNIILLLAIILIPIVLYLSLFGIFTTYIRGVVFDGLSLNIIKYLLPFIGFIIDVENVIELKDVLVYLGYILIILFLAICACKYRRLENSYHGFSYKFVANVIILLIIVSISWAILSIIGMNYVTAKEFIALNIIITLIVVFIIQFIRYRKVRYGLYALQTIAISIITTCIFFFINGLY